jgi:endonuclease/exonuclease/phosphatase family metal-dependent hydrolase
MGTQLPSISARLSKLEDAFPGYRPPSVLASGEKLTVLRRDQHVPTAAPQGSVPAKGAKLDLMTYNVWGLPGFLGARQKERMNQIGPAVRGHDVVALQETFTRHASAVGRLSQYNYQLTGSDGGLFRMKSGLTMLTSHAVLAHDFVSFQQAARADRLAEKGVLFMRIQVPGTGPVDVYTTHFQAGGTREIKRHDVDTLVNMVKRHDQGYPTFIMGDFNLTSDDAEYQDLMKRLDLRDVYAERHLDKAGDTSSPLNTNHQPTDKGHRIDSIFVRKTAAYDIAIDSAEVGMTQKFDGKHASDHFAVIGHFRITPVAKPAKACPVPAAANR